MAIETTKTDRRESDTVVNLLRDRMDTLETENRDTSNGLSEHIKECAAMQKKVLIGIVFVGTWLVTHSPEATKLAKAIFSVVPP